MAVLATKSNLEFSRLAHRILYESFRHAQGDQPNQLHFMQCCARVLREDGTAFDEAVCVRPAGRVRSLRLPRGHVAVADSALVAAQFEFWWLNLCDVLESVYRGDVDLLPDPARLRARAAAVGGRATMSSFAPEEMAAVESCFESYRTARFRSASSSHVICYQFLPRLIQVELNFQGFGERYPSRPRTDDGDPHESKLRTHCARAAGRTSADHDVIDRIYLRIIERLDLLAHNAPSDPTHLAYRRLVAAYNRNHPGSRQADLHAV